jgi:hypothetical protein
MNCKGNVGVDFVPMGGHDKRSSVNPHFAVVFGIVDVTYGNANARIIVLQCAPEGVHNQNLVVVGDFSVFR